MSVHPTDGYAAFSMWAIADAITSGTWTTQDSQAASGQDYFADQVTTLKGIDFSSVDMIVIHYGTNDFTANVEIDDTSDTDSTSTLCGALRYSLNKIMATYKNIKIFISLPIYRMWDSTGADDYTNTSGNKLSEFCEALQGVANEYHIPVIDGYNLIGLNSLNFSNYTLDNTHLNEYGRKVFGEFIGGCLIGGVTK